MIDSFVYQFFINEMKNDLYLFLSKANEQSQMKNAWGRFHLIKIMIEENCKKNSHLFNYKTKFLICTMLKY